MGGFISQTVSYEYYEPIGAKHFFPYERRVVGSAGTYKLCSVTTENSAYKVRYERDAQLSDYANYIVGGIVVGSVAVAGYQYYQARRRLDHQKVDKKDS